MWYEIKDIHLCWAINKMASTDGCLHLLLSLVTCDRRYRFEPWSVRVKWKWDLKLCGDKHCNNFQKKNLLQLLLKHYIPLCTFTSSTVLSVPYGLWPLNKSFPSHCDPILFNLTILIRSIIFLFLCSFQSGCHYFYNTVPLFILSAFPYHL